MVKTYREATAEMEEHFQVVAERIGCEWRWLGRNLKVNNSTINGIDEDYKSTKEKAFQVLVRWFQLYGQAVATKEALIEALRAIRQTSIAEELCLGGAAAPVDKRIIDNPDEEMTSFEENNESSAHTQNGFNQSLENIDKELDKLLDSCIENVMTSSKDCSAMGQTLKVVHHVQQLNTILLGSTLYENSHENETAIGERGKTRAEKRSQRIEQTIKCILQALSNQGAINQRERNSSTTRPVSEVLPRVTSEVNIERRTFSVGSTPDKKNISPPITTSTNSILSRAERRESPSPLPTIHDKVREETEFFPEQLRCERCGSCLGFEEVRRNSEASSINAQQDESSDENCNLLTMKLDFPTEETNTDHVEEENSKL